MTTSDSFELHLVKRLLPYGDGSGFRFTIEVLRHAEGVSAIAEYSDNDREIIAKCQAALAKARGEDRSHEGK